MRAALCALTALFAAGAAQAQSHPASNDVEIVVTAPDRDAVTDFVQEVGTPGGADQLARWDSAICARVVGMREDYAQFVIDRISQRAVELELEAGASGCEPNIVVIATHDSDELARILADDPDLNLPRSDNSLGRQALARLGETPRPVRWWYLTRTYTRDGVHVPRGTRAVTGGSPPQGGWRPQLVVVGVASNINRYTRQDMFRAYVVIDAQRISGVRLDSLSDYVAMVALAQIDVGADVSGAPSILNLFAGGTLNAGAPATLTDWDMAYLSGLYRANRLSRSSRQQQGQIVRDMMRQGERAP